MLVVAYIRYHINVPYALFSIFLYSRWGIVGIKDSHFVSGDNYLLKMRIIDHVFDDMTIDELQLTVILPEGVRDLNLE